MGVGERETQAERCCGNRLCPSQEPGVPGSSLALTQCLGRTRSLNSSVLPSLVTERTNEKRWARMAEARPSWKRKAGGRAEREKQSV